MAHVETLGEEHMPNERKWWHKKRWLFGAAVIALVIWVVWPASDEWIFKQELPRSAQDVWEWKHADGFLPDYMDLLKARISREDFVRYVARLNLTPHSPSRKYDEGPAEVFLNWGPRDDWWDPSLGLEGTYVDQGQDTWTFAKYENGYVYLKSFNH